MILLGLNLPEYNFKEQGQDWIKLNFNQTFIQQNQKFIVIDSFG